MTKVAGIRRGFERESGTSEGKPQSTRWEFEEEGEREEEAGMIGEEENKEKKMVLKKK